MAKWDDYTPCTQCNGRGKTPRGNACPVCKGKGYSTPEPPTDAPPQTAARPDAAPKPPEPRPLVEQRPVARRTDPGTSWAAADSVTNLTAIRETVLTLLDQRPMTDEDILAVLWRNGEGVASRSGIQTRRHELVEAGYVEDSGERVRGLTGRRMIVWRITPSGRLVLHETH